MDGLGLEVNAHAFQFTNLVFFARCVQGDGGPGHAVTARPANPVNEEFRVGRDFGVDDVRNPVDVNPAGSQVRGHHVLVTTSGNVLHHALAFARCDVPVNLRHFQTLFGQVGVQLVHSFLGVGKNQHEVRLANGEQLVDQLVGALALLGNEQVFHRVGDHRLRLELNHQRVVHVFLQEWLQLLRDRGGKDHHLQFSRERAGNFVDRVQEPHVEGHVGFVNHEGLHGVTRQRAILNEVANPAGRPDGQVHRLTRQLLFLLLAVGSPNVAADANVADVLQQQLGRLVNLGGQFATWRRDDRLQRVAGAVDVTE